MANNEKLYPMDKVKNIKTGAHHTVNDSSYIHDLVTGEQGLTLCGENGEVYPASDFELVERGIPR